MIGSFLIPRKVGKRMEEVENIFKKDNIDNYNELDLNIILKLPPSLTISLRDIIHTNAIEQGEPPQFLISPDPSDPEYRFFR